MQLQCVYECVCTEPIYIIGYIHYISCSTKTEMSKEDGDFMPNFRAHF